MAKKTSKASFLPLLVAALAISISGAIFFLARSMADAFLLHLIAYVLTPLVVALCLGNDPWFSANTSYSLILRILTGASFIAAFPHIVSMATDIAEILASK
jgi:hypothetical protein